jgi:hypothetical protein
MAQWTPKQILIGVITVLAILECLGWAVGAFSSWLFRGLAFFEPLTPDQLSQNTEFAVLVSMMLLVNVAGALAFIFSRNGYGLPALALVQVADVAVTVLIFVWRSTEPVSGSLEFSLLPAFTLLLLAVLWRSFPRRV